MIEIINLEEIKQLLKNENISAYRIGIETNISRAIINDYRRDKLDIDNMTLGYAIRLQRFINHNPWSLK